MSVLLPPPQAGMQAQTDTVCVKMFYITGEGYQLPLRYFWRAETPSAFIGYICDVAGQIIGQEYTLLQLLSSPWQESRSREILEEKLLLDFPLELEKWIFISRSPLDFQDFQKIEKKFLFLLSFH